MHRVSPNNPVRRRLIFSENVDDQARVDNFANKLQESITRDTEAMIKKYNFDFITEEPLEGPFMWYKKDNDKWIGMKPRKSDDIDSAKDDDFSSLQADNENTPFHVRKDTVPAIRARNNNKERGGRESVKRRMNFDLCSDSRRRRH